MSSYASRLSEQIPDPDPVLVGLSFGGMIAMEITKLRPVKKIILISSARFRSELPPYFRMLGYLKLHRMLPFPLIRALGQFPGIYLFGPAQDTSRRLLKTIIRQTDKRFFLWALDRIGSWDNTAIPHHITEIHGDRDHMLPIGYVRENIRIRGGGHLMVWDRAEEVSAYLQRLIEPLRGYGMNLRVRGEGTGP